MPERLTFVIQSADEFSTFGLLFKALEDIKRLLRDVDYAIYRRQMSHQWVVQSIKSSALTITLAPNRIVCCLCCGNSGSVQNEVLGLGSSVLRPWTEPFLCH